MRRSYKTPTIKIMGRGDYGAHNMGGIQSNSLFRGSTSMPTFAGKRRHIDIVHRELVADVTISATGSANAVVPSSSVVTSYYINPGLAPTGTNAGGAALKGPFPWLSTIAANFETYQLRGIAFEYRTLSGYWNSNTPALGKVRVYYSSTTSDCSRFYTAIIADILAYAYRS